MLHARILTAAFLSLLAFINPAGASGSFPWLPWYPLADHQDVGALKGIPSCGEQGMVANLLGRFNQTEFVYWGSFHNLLSVEGLSENGVHERDNDKIARRWCTGTAVFADGSRRRLVVEMASNAEWLGLTYSLAYCIVGLDRSYVHGRNCEGLQKRNF